MKFHHNVTITNALGHGCIVPVFMRIHRHPVH
jgi:hypothetical protein